MAPFGLAASVLCRFYGRACIARLPLLKEACVPAFAIYATVPAWWSSGGYALESRPFTAIRGVMRGFACDMPHNLWKVFADDGGGGRVLTGGVYRVVYAGEYAGEQLGRPETLGNSGRWVLKGDYKEVKWQDGILVDWK